MADNQDAPTFITAAQHIQDALNHVEAVAEKPGRLQADMLAYRKCNICDVSLHAGRLFLVRHTHERTGKWG